MSPRNKFPVTGWTSPQNPARRPQAILVDRLQLFGPGSTLRIRLCGHFLIRFSIIDSSISTKVG